MSDKPAPIMGVYRILNTVTNEAYIGSSVDVQQRWAQHRATFERYQARIINRRLLQAWLDYGAAAFRFELLEAVADAADLPAREQHHIAAHGWLVYNHQRIVTYHATPRPPRETIALVMPAGMYQRVQAIASGNDRAPKTSVSKTVEWLLRRGLALIDEPAAGFQA